MILKLLAATVLIPVVTVAAIVAAINVWVLIVGGRHVAQPEELPTQPPADAVLVPGAAVWNHRPSQVLADRLITALELYRAGRARKILVSGDHGQHSYDEVNAMRAWLEARGVPPEDIFCDHAGFSTYESLYRAEAVFACRSVVIATQASHLPRALYIGDRLGLEVTGVAADRWVYEGAVWQQLREVAARVKAFANVQTGRQPRYLGPVLPISGDGRATRG